MRSNAMIAAVEMRLSARGCTLSQPNPVPAGNVSHACRAAVTHSGGIACPIMAGHTGPGGCSSDCHTLAQDSASPSTSC